jgi:cyclic-di-GMP-binding protein
MPISFKLPALEENPVLLAETRTNKINEFIRELPFSDPSRAASDLIEELQILNRQRVAFSNRVNALEAYRTAAIQVSQALVPQFSYASLPISKNQKNYADTVVKLWQEMAYGYKWALIDLQNKIININSDKSAALVIQRAIHALKETAFVSYLTYHTPSKSIWAELHQLYFCALQQKAQSLTVNESLADNQESSVDSVYTQILLLALAHPHRLCSQDIVKADAYLTKVSHDAELSAIGFIESSVGVFLIELDGNEPPKAYAKKHDEPNSETDLLLLTVKVAKRIHAHLKLLNDGILPKDGCLPNNAVNNHYEDLLTHLMNHFGKAPLRVFSRVKKNDGMELGIGIHDAHYFAPKIGNDYKNLVVKSAAIKPSRWQILNIGAGGYALRKFNSSQVSMQVGEIAAIKNNDTLSWELGVIRWASINDLDQLDIGFELISPRVKAITIKSQKNAAEVKALLLPELSALKQQASFIAPRGEYTTGETIVLIEDGKETKVLVTKLIVRTSSFERYQFSLI